MNALSTLAGAASLATMLTPPVAGQNRYRVTDTHVGQSYDVDAPSPEEAEQYVKAMLGFKRVSGTLGWLLGALLATLAWLAWSKSDSHAPLLTP
jgi:hypothetical protein